MKNLEFILFVLAIVLLIMNIEQWKDLELEDTIIFIGKLGSRTGRLLSEYY